MANNTVDASFTASNFFSFTTINEAYDSSSNLQQLWNSLPEAVKEGDVEEQLRWEGDKKKLMPIVFRVRLVKAGILLSYTLIAAGIVGVAISFFYTSATFPVICMITSASGIVLNIVSRFYNLVRPKFNFCMHTHGIFIWGEVSHEHKLKGIVNRLAY